VVKKYVVRLTCEERKKLKQMVNKGKVAAYKRLHAQILLKADQSERGPAWTDLKIAESFEVSTRSIERIRKNLVEGGIDAAISRAKGGGRKRKLRWLNRGPPYSTGLL